MIRILLAEDSAILRDTLVSVLDLEDDLTVVADVATGTDIVPAASHPRRRGARHRPPRCRWVDRGRTTLGRSFRLQGPDPHRTRPARQPPSRAPRARCRFLAKDTSARDLIAAIRTIAAGGRVVGPDVAIAAIANRPSPLTPRATEILRLHARGADPREIARTLFLSYGTVRNYLASATDKLDARNRTEAVIIATQQGWL
jgi:two-component system, NarL family, response regulator DesR